MAGNRTTFKSNVTTKIQPLMTTAIHRDVLNNDLADSVVFGQDVAVIQNSGSTNITVDFTDKDRIDLTRTGGALNITVSGMGDGEIKHLLITKTTGQEVTFVGVTDITPVKANVTALGTVLYEIIRKSSNYYALAKAETVKTATTTVEGVLEIATQSESNDLADTAKAVVPAYQPIASTSQKGLVELATLAEAQALTSALLALTPATLPETTVTQKGILRAATSAEVDAGAAGSLTVIASELKRKIDELAATYLFGTVSKANPGYWNLSNGLQFRWGIAISTADEAQTFTFGTPFTTACLIVVTDSASGITTLKTKDDFVYNRLNVVDGTVNMNYLAIGF